MLVQNKTLVRAHCKKATSKNSIEFGIRHDTDMIHDLSMC